MVRNPHAYFAVKALCVYEYSGVMHAYVIAYTSWPVCIILLWGACRIAVTDVHVHVRMRGVLSLLMAILILSKGYQISSFSNRTSIVDNNLWNASHIARVGLAMVSTEDRAYRVMQELDVTHVVVRFGGFIGYKSDDLSKLPWMLKIAKTAAGGGAKIRPSDYYTKAKEFRIDALGTPSLLNSFLYVEANVHTPGLA